MLSNVEVELTEYPDNSVRAGKIYRNRDASDSELCALPSDPIMSLSIASSAQIETIECQDSTNLILRCRLKWSLLLKINKVM